jgi:hypothetical protein
VLLNGAQTNPNSVKLPTGQTLKGAELASFKLKMQDTNREFANLISQGERLKVASAADILR